MRYLHTVPVVLAIALAVASPAGADLVYLKSGKILGGQISEGEGGLVLVSGTSRVSIAHDMVERFELGRSLEDLVKDKVATTPEVADARYELGRWFAQHGLGVAAEEAWQRSIALEPEHLLARRALGQVKQNGQWVHHKDLVRAAGLVRKGERWTLPPEAATATGGFEAPPAEPDARLAWAATRLPEHVRLTTGAPTAEGRARAEVARRQVVHGVVEVLLRAESPAHRRRAADLLGKEVEASAVPSLVRSTLADRDAGVREGAVAALNAIALPQTALYYVKPLECSVEAVRHNAIEVLGQLQGNRATEVLVQTMAAVYGGGPRVYIYIGDQISYIKDYDVEVADTAAIADPEIGVVQSGAVLDVKVMRIIEWITVRETQLIAQALEKRTGQAFGADPQRWLAWWEKQGDAAR